MLSSALSLSGTLRMALRTCSHAPTPLLSALACWRSGRWRGHGCAQQESRGARGERARAQGVRATHKAMVAASKSCPAANVAARSCASPCVTLVTETPSSPCAITLRSACATRHDAQAHCRHRRAAPSPCAATEEGMGTGGRKPEPAARCSPRSPLLPPFSGRAPACCYCRPAPVRDGRAGMSGKPAGAEHGWSESASCVVANTSGRRQRPRQQTAQCCRPSF